MGALEIKYDEQIEVSEQQYRAVVKAFPGIIAHRKSEGKFYIKVWLMKYKYEIAEMLTNIE